MDTLDLVDIAIEPKREVLKRLAINGIVSIPLREPSLVEAADMLTHEGWLSFEHKFDVGGETYYRYSPTDHIDMRDLRRRIRL